VCETNKELIGAGTRMRLHAPSNSMNEAYYGGSKNESNRG